MRYAEALTQTWRVAAWKKFGKYYRRVRLHHTRGDDTALRAFSKETALLVDRVTARKRGDLGYVENAIEALSPFGKLIMQTLELILVLAFL